MAGDEAVAPAPVPQGGTPVPITCIPLSLLLSRQVKRSFLGLQQVQERAAAADDLGKKILLRDWAKESRKSWIRLLVLVAWYRKHSSGDSQAANGVGGQSNGVAGENGTKEGQEDGQEQLLDPSRLALLRGSLLHHDAMLNDVANSFFTAQQNMIFCQVPAFDVSTAIDVLTTGEYIRLPSCIKDAVVPEQSADADDESGDGDDDVAMGDAKAAQEGQGQAHGPNKALAKVRSLEDAAAAEVVDHLHGIIDYRLFSSAVPDAFTSIRVADGRAYCTVEDEFQVQLSLDRDEPDCPWRVLAVRVFVRGMGATEQDRSYASPVDIDFCKRMANFLQHRLLSSSRPLAEVYAVMHALCLSLALQMLRKQLAGIYDASWRDQLDISSRSEGNLTIRYWRRKLQGSLTAGAALLPTTDAENHSVLRTAVDPSQREAEREKSVVGVPVSGAGVLSFDVIDAVGSHEAGVKVTHSLPESCAAESLHASYLPFSRISAEHYLLKCVAHHAKGLLLGMCHELLGHVDALPFDESDIHTAILDASDCSRMMLRVRLFGSCIASLSIHQFTGEFILRLSLEGSRTAAVVERLQAKLNAGTLASFSELLLPLKHEVVLLTIERCLVQLGLEAFNSVELVFTQESPAKAGDLFPAGVLYLRMGDWPDYFLVVEVTDAWCMNVTLVRTRDSVSLVVEEVREVERDTPIDGIVISGLSPLSHKNGSDDDDDDDDGDIAMGEEEESERGRGGREREGKSARIALVEASMARLRGKLTTLVHRCSREVIGEMHYLRQLGGSIRYSVAEGRINFDVPKGDTVGMPIKSVTIQYNRSLQVWEALCTEEKKIFTAVGLLARERSERGDASASAGALGASERVTYFPERGIWRFRYPALPKEGPSALWRDMKVTGRLVGLLEQWQELEKKAATSGATEALANRFRLASFVPFSYVGFEYGAGLRLGITCSGSRRSAFSLSLSVHNPLKAFFEMELNARKSLRRLLQAVWRSTPAVALLHRYLTLTGPLRTGGFSLIPRSLLQARLQYRTLLAVDFHFILDDSVALSDASAPLFHGAAASLALHDRSSSLRPLVEFDAFLRETVAPLAAPYRRSPPAGALASPDADLLYKNDHLVPHAVFPIVVDRLHSYLLTCCLYESLFSTLRAEIPVRAFDDSPAYSGTRLRFSLKSLPGVRFELLMKFVAVELHFSEKSIASTTDSLLGPSTTAQPFSSSACPLNAAQLEHLRALFTQLVAPPVSTERITAFIRLLSMPPKHLTMFLQLHKSPVLRLLFQFPKKYAASEAEFKAPIVHDFTVQRIHVIFERKLEGAKGVAVPLTFQYRHSDNPTVAVWAAPLGLAEAPTYAATREALGVVVQKLTSAPAAELKEILASGHFPGLQPLSSNTVDLANGSTAQPFVIH